MVIRARLPKTRRLPVSRADQGHPGDSLRNV